MDLLFTALGAIVGVAIGVVSGFWVGGKLKERSSFFYWLANFGAVLIGVAGDVAGLTWGQWWAVVGSLAFIGGSLTGLKYGYGRSVGVWRVHDDLVGSKDLPRN